MVTAALKMIDAGPLPPGGPRGPSRAPAGGVRAGTPKAPAAASRRPSPWRRLTGWPFPLAVLLLWYLGARHQWIAPQVLPSPEAVWLTLVDLVRSGEIWGHLRISLVRVFAGFGLGLAAGGALGV